MDIKASLKRMNDYLNSLPQTIKNSPVDEQIAYYVIFAGILLMVIGMFTTILF